MATSQYRFAEEEFTYEGYDEIFPLLMEHWKEVAHDQELIPLNPNKDRYMELARQGMIHCLSCRTEDGEVVGYMITFLDTHIHYKDTIFASNDLIYIAPGHRKGLLGLRMIKEFENCMRRALVDVIHMHVKPHVDYGPLLSRQGYVVAETIYRKYIGE
jgi:hypothetical protein|tara:strand:+ start:1413 stop:1886 length:474 start_codon:yes stop_codon:yes gene_type:complete